MAYSEREREFTFGKNQAIQNHARSCLSFAVVVSIDSAPEMIEIAIGPIPLVMVALWNRADHYIFALWFLLLSSFFFPRLISAVADWMCAILPDMMWP